MSSADGLVVGQRARGDAGDEGADLVPAERPAVALLYDDVDRAHPAGSILRESMAQVSQLSPEVGAGAAAAGAGARRGDPQLDAVSAGSPGRGRLRPAARRRHPPVLARRGLRHRHHARHADGRGHGADLARNGHRRSGGAPARPRPAADHLHRRRHDRRAPRVPARADARPRRAPREGRPRAHLGDRRASPRSRSSRSTTRAMLAREQRRGARGRAGATTSGDRSSCRSPAARRRRSTSSRSSGCSRSPGARPTSATWRRPSWRPSARSTARR